MALLVNQKKKSKNLEEKHFFVLFDTPEARATTEEKHDLSSRPGHRGYNSIRPSRPTPAPMANIQIDDILAGTPAVQCKTKVRVRRKTARRSFPPSPPCV